MLDMAYLRDIIASLVRQGGRVHVVAPNVPLFGGSNDHALIGVEQPAELRMPSHATRRPDYGRARDAATVEVLVVPFCVIVRVRHGPGSVPSSGVNRARLP